MIYCHLCKQKKEIDEFYNRHYLSGNNGRVCENCFQIYLFGARREKRNLRKRERRKETRVEEKTKRIYKKECQSIRRSILQADLGKKGNIPRDLRQLWKFRANLQRANLGTRYLKDLIKRVYHIRSEQISSELLEFKRNQLQLLRLTRQFKRRLSNGTN